MKRLTDKVANRGGKINSIIDNAIEIEGITEEQLKELLCEIDETLINTDEGKRISENVIRMRV